MKDETIALDDIKVKSKDEAKIIFNNGDEFAKQVDVENEVTLAQATEDFPNVLNKGANIAVENDWLELCYAERYIPKSEESKVTQEQEKEQDKNETVPVKRKRISAAAYIGKINKKGLITAGAVAVVIIAVICAFSFGGVNAKSWWNDVKTGALTVFGVKANKNKIDLSATTLVDSITNGDIIIKGGQLSLTLSDGTVKTVTDNSVTIEYDKNTCITYSSIKDIMVIAGQKVSKFDIIGKYDEMCIINVIYQNEKVINVAKINNAIVWEI
ncbi:MAG: hypothetical protein RR054_02995 [Clostridia bacterium]